MNATSVSYWCDDEPPTRCSRARVVVEPPVRGERLDDVVLRLVRREPPDEQPVDAAAGLAVESSWRGPGRRRVVERGDVEQDRDDRGRARSRASVELLRVERGVGEAELGARASSSASWRRPFMSVPAIAGSHRAKNGAGVMLW